MARRSFEMGEDPNDVIKRIDKFINNEDNTTSIMESINDIMKGVDRLERTVGNIEDDKYRNEMLGYVAKIRQYVISTLDSFDSMMDI